MSVRMEYFVRKMQKEIVAALSEIELAEQNKLGVAERPFLIDEWQRSEGGGGISCILQDGVVFEKAGVNISIIHGILTPRNPSLF